MVVVIVVLLVAVVLVVVLWSGRAHLWAMWGSLGAMLSQVYVRPC